MCNMKNKITGGLILIVLLVSGCSTAKPTQFNANNTATVFIGSENIDIPIPTGFERASEEDKHIVQLITKPPLEYRALAVFKKKSNSPSDKYFVTVANPYKSINTDKYISNAIFKETKRQIHKYLTSKEARDDINSSEYKQELNKYGKITGFYMGKPSLPNRFIDHLNAVGYSYDFLVFIDTSSKTPFRALLKSSLGTITLKVKEKLLSVQVLNISGTKNIKHIEKLSKKIANQIFNLNNSASLIK
jgi:hypothetical protein